MTNEDLLKIACGIICDIHESAGGDETKMTYSIRGKDYRIAVSPEGSDATEIGRLRKAAKLAAAVLSGEEMTKQKLTDALEALRDALNDDNYTVAQHDCA